MTDPALASNLVVVLAVGTLMLLSGLGKRRLERRPREQRRRRPAKGGRR